MIPEALRQDVFKFGFAFTLAALIHASQVKREISKQFTIMADAFNNLANALRQDLSEQTKRIVKVEERVDKLTETLKKT